jgi:hypothetical protein
MSSQNVVANPRPDSVAVLDAVSAALRDVVTEDGELLEVQAHELAIVHRFAVYLGSRLQRELKRDKLTIDMDYDRREGLPKWLPQRLDRRGDDPRRFRPDLIVHRRNDNANNLLVVEWKKNADDEVLASLEERIDALLANDGREPIYNYQLGVIANSSDHGIRWRPYEIGGPIGDWRELSVLDAVSSEPQVAAARCSGPIPAG